MNTTNHLGLTVSEHNRASRTLSRVYRLLAGLRRLVDRRYPVRHPITAGLNESIANLQAVRVAAENAARSEHPDSGVVYLAGGSIAVNPTSVEDAIATIGEDVETND